MALDFPNNPTVGQTFAGPGGVIWTWDNVKWVGGGSSGGGGSSSVVVSPTPPASPTVGQLWWDSTGGQLYIRYEDPNTQQWVTTHNIGFGVPLSVASGGTGILTYSQGDMIYGSAPDTLARLTKSTAATRYLANTGASNNPAWDQINLTNGVTGILPVASGGTGGTGVCIVGPVAPPSSPGALWWDNNDGGGQLYISYNDGNTTQWVSAACAPGAFLPLLGGTLTGGLTIAPTSGPAGVILRKPASGVSNDIWGFNGSNARWTLALGDANAESSGNAGSNFAVYRYNDAGTLIDVPFFISRATGETITAGDISMIKSLNPTLNIIKTTGGSAINGKVGANARWQMLLGDGTTETGSNVGSDFRLNRHNDAGVALDAPFWINRQTAITTISSYSAHDPLVLIANTNFYARIKYTNQRVWSAGVSGVDGSWLIADESAPSVRLQITTGGACSASSTWTVMSDERVKQDVQPYTHGLAEVLQLEPVSYRHNGKAGFLDDGSVHCGFIAQQVETVLPELVDEVPGYSGMDSEGNFLPREFETIKTVRAADTVLALVNAIKELDTRLRSLEGAL